MADNSFNPVHVLRKLAISIGNHDSKNIFIVGHYDCAANPVDEDTHKDMIKKAVKRIKNYTLASEIAGLWISKYLEVERICVIGGVKENDSPVYEYSTSG